MDLPSFSAEPTSTPARAKDPRQDAPNGGAGAAGADAEGAAALAFAELIDRANAPIFSLDLEGRVTEWNHYIGQAAGVLRDTAIGGTLADHVSSDSLAALQEALRKVGDGTFGLPFELSFATGPCPVTLLVTLSAQLDVKGKTIGAMCIGQILVKSGADPKAPDKKSVEASDMARKTKGMVMHELRSPLHGIIGLSTTLSQDESPMQKPLKMIGGSAERVLELVTNLMDYWNLADDPNQEVPQDPIDFPTLVNEILTKCEQAKDKRGRPMKKDKVTIIREVPASLPTMYGDPQAILQMLYHLTMNALKFTHQGHVTIAVAPNNRTKCMDITVEDTGIGISKGSIKRVFEPFQQEDTSESRRYEGIGLGLAIVSEVVRLHGGSINVNSSQDKGTTFVVSLPYKLLKASAGAAGRPMLTSPPKQPRSARPSLWLGPPNLLPPMVVAPPASAPAMPTAPPPGSTKAAPAGSPTQSTAALAPSPTPRSGALRTICAALRDGPRVIMSVDDDHINQEVMRSVLEPCGFKIIVCMSGTECLAHFEQEGHEIPELILLDLMMPGINGFDVLEEQRKTFSPEVMPIIMVSAKNQTSSVVKGLELGCNDWIHKPFDRQELIARVNAHLRLRDVVLGYESMLASGDAAGQAAAGAPSATPAAAEAPPVAPERPISGPLETTVLFMGVIAAGSADAVLPRLFECFEALSQRHGAAHTEMVGSCYIVIMRGSPQEPQHTENMLKLALGLEDAVRRANAERDPRMPILCRIGIHTDSHTPVNIPSKMLPSGFRQYPTSSLFGSVVGIAKALGESPARGCVVLSRSARSRLGPDAEHQVRNQGIQMISGLPESGSAAVDEGELFCLVREGEQPHVPRAPKPPTVAVAANGVPAGDGAALLDQLRHAQREGEAHAARLRDSEAHAARLSQGLQQAQHDLHARQEQMLEARAEARNLRLQIEELRNANGKESGISWQGGAPSTGSLPLWQPVAAQQQIQVAGDAPSANASVLFLQWQNAHLNAELRSAQQALAAVKTELQVQVMNCHAAERKQMMLMERAEHLELDLGFRAALGGLPGIGAIASSFGCGNASLGVGLGGSTLSAGPLTPTTGCPLGVGAALGAGLSGCGLGGGIGSLAGAGGSAFGGGGGLYSPGFAATSLGACAGLGAGGAGGACSMLYSGPESAFTGAVGGAAMSGFAGCGAPSGSHAPATDHLP